MKDKVRNGERFFIPAGYETAIPASGKILLAVPDGANRIPEFIQGIEFKDEIKQLQTAA